MAEDAKAALQVDAVPQLVKVKLSDEYAQDIADEHTRIMKDLAPRQEYQVSIDGSNKTYKRRKIRTRERKQLEILRQKYTQAVMDNSPQYPEFEDQLYKKMASYYLVDPGTGEGMTADDFDGTDFEEVKKIMNACAFRTERPIPLGK